MALPLFDGAVQETTTCPFPGVTVGASGVAGNPKTVAWLLFDDHAPIPAVLRAATRNT